MKYFLNATLLFLAILLPVIAPAHDFEVDGIYYNKNGDKATVTYRGSSYSSYSNEYTGEVVIPASVTYDGITYPVTTIGKYAFKGCRSLISVTIPESFIIIDYCAFEDCSGLTDVIIPNTNANTYIENLAFRGCYSLTSIALPNSLKTIGAGAFRDCRSLTSITIPNSVDNIRDGAFSGCSGLTSIIVESGNITYDSRNDCNAIIKTASNTLIAGCKNTMIPNSVIAIGEQAFSGCTGLTGITIPNSVTSIGGSAFSSCTGLTGITIPNSVTSIGRGAFYNCDNLTSITIPNSLKTYCSLSAIVCPV